MVNSKLLRVIITGREGEGTWGSEGGREEGVKVKSSGGLEEHGNNNGKIDGENI
jgi:hypothetical protein